MDNRRNFFIGFARKKGFDPLVPKNWGDIKCNEIFEQVGRSKRERERERKKE